MLSDCPWITGSQLPSWDCAWHGEWAGSFGVWYGNTYIGQGGLTIMFLGLAAVLLLFAWTGSQELD